MENKKTRNERRKEYFDVLKLQESNNDFNFQANALYAQSGIPQQPTDNRTSDEKMRDIEGIKQAVRKSLSMEIMDSTQANKVVQNISSDDLKYLSNRINDIIKYTKRKWSSGVNATIFMGILKQYASEAVKMQSTSDLLDIASTGLKRVGSVRAEDGRVADSRSYDDVVADIQGLKQMVRNKLGSIMDSTQANDVVESLEDNNRLIYLSNRIDDIIRTSKWTGRMNASIFLTIFDNYILRENNEIINFKQGDDDDSKLNFGFEDDEDDINMAEEDFQPAEIIDRDGTLPLGYKQKTEVENLSNNEINEYIDSFKKGEFKNNDIRELMKRMDINKTSRVNDKKAFFIRYDNFIFNSLQEQGNDGDIRGRGVKAFKMKGRGVGRPVTRNYEGSTRPVRSDVLTADDIDGVNVIIPRFSTFGHHLINKRQLDKNIISIKTIKGGSINGLKSQKCSAKMAHILRDIVGGSIPTESAINKLDDAEKEYLYKVASTSGFINKLQIQAPNKSKEDKEIDTFQLMKGQILCGNDNKEYIKKFKMMIMKLEKNGLLPTKDAKEVLYEMLLLGY